MCGGLGVRVLGLADAGADTGMEYSGASRGLRLNSEGPLDGREKREMVQE